MSNTTRLLLTHPGASIPPEAMMHFPLFQISSLFSKNFQTVENVQNFNFSHKFFHFHPPKFLMTFLLVIDHTFRISPSIFSVSVHFPPVSRKLLFPPTLKNFPPVFQKFTCFF